jgi:hypothetical protein
MIERPASSRLLLQAVLLGALELAGLLTFLFMITKRGPVGAPVWANAFKTGATIVVIFYALRLRHLASSNGLILGANVWLMLGGLATAAHLGAILAWYDMQREASVFIVIFVVGGLLTLVAPGGFVGVNVERRRVLLASAALLAMVVVDIAVAVHFRGNLRWGAVVPMAVLIWMSRLVRRRLSTASVQP